MNARCLVPLLPILLLAPICSAEQLEVASLEGLREAITRDGVTVRMRPGTYVLDRADGADFLDFTGNGSRFDFRDVTLEVPTRLYAGVTEGINVLALKGSDLMLVGLKLEVTGEDPPPGGMRAISVLGDRITLRNLEVTVRGSFPYGYGSYLGIGQGAAVKLMKSNGIRVGGIDCRLENIRVRMLAFGHGIFLRGAHNTVLKNCLVEGALRPTDEILAETSGPAFDLGFKQYTGEPIPAGRMTSLSEDGIRVYPNDPGTGRRTTNVTIENCEVRKMRRGICTAFAVGTIRIVSSRVIDCERAGFHVGTNTTVESSEGNARHGWLFDISSSRSKDAKVELRALDSRDGSGNRLLGKINGTAHVVRVTEAQQGFVPDFMTIQIASDEGFGEGRMEETTAARVRLENRTSARVVVNAGSKAADIASYGAIEDAGEETKTRKLR